MTKDMKKIIGYVVSSAVVDVAGGMVALDIFNKAIGNLPLKRSTFRSIGLFSLKYGAFNAGMDFAEKYTNGTLKSIFGIDKMDAKQVADDMIKELAKKVNSNTDDKEAAAEETDDISEESEEEEEE